MFEYNTSEVFRYKSIFISYNVAQVSNSIIQKHNMVLQLFLSYSFTHKRELDMCINLRLFYAISTKVYDFGSSKLRTFITILQPSFLAV